MSTQSQPKTRNSKKQLLYNCNLLFFRRRKECSAGGIPECDNIPGCCAEHFDVVYGVGVYLPQGSEPGEV